MDKKIKKDRRMGYFHLTLFFILIMGGIITKRVYGYPQFMMLWHLPAAVFLVLGGRLLTKANRIKYYKNR